MAKWLLKSLISMVLIFCVSGYLLYVTTGQAPWTLLGHPTAGSFFYSLLPEINVDAAQQSMRQGLGKVERTVTQFVPSETWGEEQGTSMKPSTEVYRWVDDEGVTHFSETPPLDRESDKLELAPLANILPAQAPVDNSFERENTLQSLREDMERQEAEKARILNEL
ncbi:DUF4124 domain-containing protein [Simiduia curdlanivorans]|uniref:DUF4124 domain-containing protein n=1 Tax=Simiduia curdlanivorans TaxID=1492769 RepID=A0ABV8V6Z3_9GAMM|nr:DUF4124 domain-containing protein [Simiduia curdlanivorans]MDN3639018.1 DUF4124 domain-containing protein [Simiduia curdlanivorans]